MYTLSVTTFTRSVPRLLEALQQDWTKDNVARHAETMAIALNDMSRRPGYSARAVLPAALDFVEINGMHGVDGILWSALSAASVHAPREFLRAIDRLTLLSAQPKKVPRPKPAFKIAFVDFGSLNDAPRPAATGRSRTSEAVHGRVLSGLIAERLGAGAPFFGGDAERLAGRYGAVGAGIIIRVLHSSHTDKARQLLSDLKSLTEAGDALAGFGFTMRRGANGLDQFESPGTDHAADWTKGYKNALDAAIWSFEKTAASGGAAAGVVAGAGKVAVNPFVEGVAAGMGLAAGALYMLAEQLKVVRKAVGDAEQQIKDVEKTLKKLSQGNTDDPDKKKKTEMPVPDDIGDGGRPSIFELLQALAAYLRRLDPYINPGSEDLGGGVTMASVPVSGDIDPLWEDADRFTMSEADLLALLGFLEAKYRLSFVDPVPD